MDAEGMLKALDKRVSGIERALDALTKEVRTAGVDALDKRLLALEKTVEGVRLMVKNHDSVIKTLSAGTDQKAVDAANAELRKLNNRAAEQDKKITEAYQAKEKLVSLAQFDKAGVEIDKLRKQREQMKASIDAVSMAQTKAQIAIQTKLEKEIQQQRDALDTQQREIEKIVRAAKEQGEKTVERNYLETRLKLLDDKIAVAMAVGRR